MKNSIKLYINTVTSSHLQTEVPFRCIFSEKIYYRVLPNSPNIVLCVLQDAGRNLKLGKNTNLSKVRFCQVSCGVTVKAVAWQTTRKTEKLSPQTPGDGIADRITKALNTS